MLKNIIFAVVFVSSMPCADTNIYFEHNKFKTNNMKLILKIVLLVAILALSYMVYESIMEPVRFNQEKDARRAKVIERLQDIRSAEDAYKAFNGKYMASWDTLIDFIANNQFPIVKEVADPNDTTNTIVIRDTIGYVNMTDSLFGSRKNFKIQDLKFVPIPKKYADGDVFELDAGEIKRGGLPVQVFECKTPYDVMLKGLDKQLIVNLNKQMSEQNKYSGLKVGSMEEASTEGNWK
ncbi:MAG: hypothetical protein CSB02_00795 [Bacteroidia bacterium]|nr:MAG: hypothetical protein CSB02_00795 [Bacteroidia bacterium]